MEGKDHPTTAFTTMTVQLISNTLPSREGQADMGPPVARKARDEEAGAPGTNPWKDGKVSRVCVPSSAQGPQIQSILAPVQTTRWARNSLSARNLCLYLTMEDTQKTNNISYETKQERRRKK